MDKYTELISQISAKSKRVSELFKNAETRENGANTKEELDEIKSLNAEIATMEAQASELKEAAEIKSANDARMKAFAEPAQKPVLSNGNNNGEARKSVAVYSSIGSLKHINFGATRQENEETAYRFFKFFAATCLHPESQVRVKAAQYCKDNGIPLVKALQENQNDQGGALVPAEFDPMLIRLVETYGRFRQFAKITPMASDTKAQPRRTGGVSAYWVGEGRQITSSNPTFDNVNLVAKKLASITVMSSEISEDSAINIADELAFEIGFAFALAEDQAGFLGDGTSTYGGITGVTQKLKGLSGTIANIAGLQVATGTGYGSSYASTTLADFNAVVGLLPQYADTPNTGWFVHKGYYHNVMQRLELAAGGVTANEIATGDRRPRPLFLGYPVNFCQVMPRTSATSQVCALLGDLSLAATMGDRRTRTLFTDPYSLADYDQIRVRGTERIDINIHDVGNADATAANRVPGPVVGLITAAS